MMNIKWRKTYATLIGWAAWLMVVIIVGPVFVRITEGPTPPSPVAFFGLPIFMLVLSPILCYIGQGMLNRVMMRKTGTNQELIAGLLRGAYDEQIPMKLRTQEGKMRLLRILETGQATTIYTAVAVARRKNFNRKVGLVSWGIFKMVDGAVTRKTNEFLDDMAAIGENIADSNPFAQAPAPAPVDNTWQRTQLEKEAYGKRYLAGKQPRGSAQRSALVNEAMRCEQRAKYL